MENAEDYRFESCPDYKNIKNKVMEILMDAMIFLSGFGLGGWLVGRLLEK
jgi:hypothetical protein